VFIVKRGCKEGSGTTGMMWMTIRRVKRTQTIIFRQIRADDERALLKSSINQFSLYIFFYFYIFIYISLCVRTLNETIIYIYIYISNGKTRSYRNLKLLIIIIKLKIMIVWLDSTRFGSRKKNTVRTSVCVCVCLVYRSMKKKRRKKCV
jgi:hypothetical protein